jgi:hypothetical protein
MVMSLGALLTCLVTAIFSHTQPNATGISVSAILLVIGFPIGGIGQLAYRKMVTDAP